MLRKNIILFVYRYFTTYYYLISDALQSPEESIFTADNSLTWKIMPVEPSSSFSGFYHFAIFSSDSKLKQASQLSKLSSNGTVLKSTSIDLFPEDVVGYSNSHGHLSFCTTKSKIEKVRCRIFDSQLNELSENISIGFGDVSLYTKKMSVANVVDSTGTILMLLSICEDSENVCQRESTIAFKVEASDDRLPLGKIMMSGEGCFPRKSYDVFEITSKGLFCASKPCMSKRNVDDKAYDVSVSFQCYDFVQV